MHAGNMAAGGLHQLPPHRWARATLEEHAGDPRPSLLPYSQLDRGGSGDAFWDAAQKQLVRTGEEDGGREGRLGRWACLAT